jgi:hypothetical protein
MMKKFYNLLNKALVQIGCFISYRVFPSFAAVLRCNGEPAAKQQPRSTVSN